MDRKILKTNYLLFVFITYFLVSVTASAANWTLISADENNEVEIDNESVRPNKAAWFKFVFTPPSKDSCRYASKGVAYMQFYVEAKCNEHTTRTKQTIFYAKDQSVLGECNSADISGPFLEYVPETYGEIFFKAICDPKSRSRNKFAEYIRERKADQAKAEEAARKRAQEEASKTQKGEELRRWEEKNAATEALKKPYGAECGVSSECRGTLVCGKVGDTKMQCMTSEQAIK